jgi:hypothetical protein
MKKLSLLASLLLVISCKKDNLADKLNPAQWIVGNWEQKTDKGILTESWQRLNDSVFVGSCYFINESDTLHRETMLLEQRADSITYSANVTGQQPTPIAWSLKTLPTITHKKWCTKKTNPMA